MTAQEFFGEWYKCLNPIELNNVIAKVRPLYEHHKIYPSFKEIFNAFKFCDYNKLKVVIIGMDPYNDGSANGLAFANRPGTKILSPSLQVIKNCLGTNYVPKKQNFDITLQSWARQGVLLLNSSLTVESKKPGSHSIIWGKFISTFLQSLSQLKPNIIYVLMGEQAKIYKPYIKAFNNIIICKHPAYYARIGEQMPNIFTKIDELTFNKNKDKIIWI